MGWLFKVKPLGISGSVIDDVGFELGVAQLGGKHPAAKPWKEDDPGVTEIVERHDGNAYRVVYTVRFAGTIYVLQAFQKKSPAGIKTDKRDVDLVGERPKRARADYEKITTQTPSEKGKRK